MRLTGLSNDQRRIRIELLPSLEEAASVPITATVSLKPYIWVLWLGCALVVVGCMASASERKGNMP